MGWPKKNEGYRLYYERKPKTYLLVTIDPDQKEFLRPCVGELMIHNNPDSPKLFHGQVSDQYIRDNWLKRVEWGELPEVWKQAFKQSHFDIEPVEDPLKIRGLWRIAHFPHKERRN